MHELLQQGCCSWPYSTRVQGQAVARPQPRGWAWGVCRVFPAALSREPRLQAAGLLEARPPHNTVLVALSAQPGGPECTDCRKKGHSYNQVLASSPPGPCTQLRPRTNSRGPCVGCTLWAAGNITSVWSARTSQAFLPTAGHQDTPKEAGLASARPPRGKRPDIWVQFLGQPRGKNGSPVSEGHPLLGQVPPP